MRNLHITPPVTADEKIVIKPSNPSTVKARHYLSVLVNNPRKREAIKATKYLFEYLDDVDKFFDAVDELYQVIKQVKK